MAFDLESRGTNTHLWVTGSRGALMVLPADVELGEEPQELHVARGLRSERQWGLLVENSHFLLCSFHILEGKD